MIPLCTSPWQGWKRFSFLIGRVNLTKPLAPPSNHKSKSCVIVRTQTQFAACLCPQPWVLTPERGGGKWWLGSVTHTSAWKSGSWLVLCLLYALCLLEMKHQLHICAAGCFHCRHYKHPVPVFLHLTTPEWPWPLQEGILRRAWQLLFFYNLDLEWLGGIQNKSPYLFLTSPHKFQNFCSKKTKSSDIKCSH